MTHVYDDPATFRADALAGFAAAYDRYAEPVPGASGLVRAGGPRRGKVSLVVGGGSGHYPSYAGIVGAGLADGCVLGDVFTSPSAEQVYRVARAADGGAGVVLAFGNYAGDRLNFAAARERLEAGGTETRIVYVTDDIASAPVGEEDRRRGIAGTAVVYKVGGAAADLGRALDDVEAAMRAANAATFSYGVAFGGCTLPGAGQPLFGVADGQMDFGLGIHGEPGISSDGWMPADALAEALVSALLAERPDGADGRVALVVNGLGATKYEELFVLYAGVARVLADAGVVPVLPEVGELVTSLDMAGCSVSLTWLDDDLEELWRAPVDAAAFRRGDVSVFPAYDAMGVRAAEGSSSVHGEATPESRADAAVVCRALAAVNDAVHDAADELGRLDAVAGDGDHGTGMVRGTDAAVAAAHTAVEDGAGVAGVLGAAGDAFSDRAGGTSGILWGILLATLGESLGDTEPVTGERLAVALRAGLDRLGRVGGARPGDKTMLDALAPFVEAFDPGDGGTARAWRTAAEAATKAADATRDLRPAVGRARPLAERSVGTPDPGAVSMALALTAVGRVLEEEVR